MKTAACRSAVFLDRDGTVSRYIEYCCRPEDFHLLPDAGPAIRRLNDAGLLVIVITNQSAIARGWLTLQRLDQIHDKMRADLQRWEAVVDAIYVCPHHPEDGCACRKPSAALFTQAAEKFRLSLSTCYAVGDRLLDVRAGQNAGVKTVLVRSGHEPEPSNGIVPNFEANTLTEAVAWILQQAGTQPRSIPRRLAGIS